MNNETIDNEQIITMGQMHLDLPTIVHCVIIYCSFYRQFFVDVEA